MADPVNGDAPRTCVDRPYLPHQGGRVSLRREHVAYRPRDIRWRESRRRNLIEQRLEAIMVLTVDHRHVDRRIPQRFRGLYTTESRTNDDDPRSFRRSGGLIHATHATQSSSGGNYLLAAPVLCPTHRVALRRRTNHRPR